MEFYYDCCRNRDPVSRYAIAKNSKCDVVWLFSNYKPSDVDERIYFRVDFKTHKDLTQFQDNGFKLTCVEFLPDEKLAIYLKREIPTIPPLYLKICADRCYKNVVEGEAFGYFSVKIGSIF